MHVLFDADVYRWQQNGGITRIYSNVLPRCAQQSAKFSVDIWLDSNAAQDPPSGPRLTLQKPLDSRKWLRPSRLWQPLQPLVQKQALAAQWQWLQRRADVFHPSYYRLPTGLRLPIVVTVYDMIHERHPQWFDSDAEREVVKRKHACIQAADAVMCISAATKRDVAEFCGVEGAHVQVVHLAHEDNFRPLDGMPTGDSETPYLLYVGARLVYKNFQPLLRAFAEQREVPILKVVGPAWNTEERALIDKLNCAGRVELHSGVSDAALLALYQGALALVYPSAYEGFGIPLLEAMASGCPLIASDIPSTREVAAELPSYIDPAEPESWQQAFAQVTDSEWRKSRIAAGLTHAQGFSWDRCAAETLAVYQGFER